MNPSHEPAATALKRVAVFAGLALSLTFTAPATAQDDNWRSNVSNEGAPILDTGPEHAFFRLTCAGHGEVAVEAQLNRRPPSQRRTTLIIQSDVVRDPVPARISSLAGTYVAEARVQLHSPLLRAFARTGRIQFSTLGQTLTPVPAAPSVVADFVHACGAWRAH